MNMMRKRIGIALLAAAVVLPVAFAPQTAQAGFGGGIGISLGGKKSAPQTPLVSYAGVRAHSVAEELTVEEKDGRLLLALKVRNEGDMPYSVTHPTGQNVDFVLLDGAGKEIWRWSSGMAFTQAFQTFTVAAGAEQTFTAEIDRKTYKDLRKQAAFAVAGLTDTGVYISAQIPVRQSGGGMGTTVTGGVVFGGVSWSRW